MMHGKRVWDTNSNMMMVVIQVIPANYYFDSH